MGGTAQKHDELKQQIKKQPSLIGIRNVYVATEEVALYRDGDHLIRIPDLLFLAEKADKNGKYNNYLEWILVEVKSGCSQKRLERAMEQLFDAKHYLKEHLGVNCRTVIAYREKNGDIAWQETANK